MRGRRWLVVLALVGAAALIAGCGGGGGGSTLSKAQYEQQVQASGKALEKALSAMGSTASMESLGTGIASARDGLKKAAADLESLKPPKEAEAANKAFVAALRAVEAELGTMQEALKKKDMAALATAAQKLSTSKEIAAAQKAAAELKKKGYELGALGN